LEGQSLQLRHRSRVAVNGVDDGSGGSWVFIHRMLLDLFRRASAAPCLPPRATSSPRTIQGV
jgi:hypothetical protein